MLVTDVSRSPLEMGKVIKSKSHRGNVKMVTTTCVQSLIIHFIYYRVNVKLQLMSGYVIAT
jgi:hypothetical protein